MYIFQAIAEKEKAEKLLEELENASQPSKAETREVISEEERYMLRKVGLKMKQFLLLGGYSPQPCSAYSTVHTSVLNIIMFS